MALTETKEFKIGTTGWTASDLDDPAIEAKWFAGRHEIINGALTEMPAAYYAGGAGGYRLSHLATIYFDSRGIGGSFASEADIIVSEDRVLVADFAFMSIERQALQERAVEAAGRIDPTRTRLLVPPDLIIESISPGHERHDRVTKLAWYAEFGVPAYWIVDAFKKRLDCYSLAGGKYMLDVGGEALSTVSPKAFPGLTIDLRRLWSDERP